jgi:acyl-CoA hydrolase
LRGSGRSHWPVGQDELEGLNLAIWFAIANGMARRGAYASNGGKSFICLASTYDKRGERRSRIVLELTPGNIVTTPRSDVMYVVTEYGMVSLKGKSVAERAKALISIAHPDFREDLERQAYEHRLIPRGVSF